jgi:superfamily II DNA or RNA helicase
VRLKTKGDYVFFVTQGQSQGDHVFDEGISPDGAFAWQSQPRNSLSTPMIQEFVHHDATRSHIYLFYRTDKVSSYYYLGELAYVSHDPTRECPVYFTWRLIDWTVPIEEAEGLGIRVIRDSPKRPKRRGGSASPRHIPVEDSCGSAAGSWVPVCNGRTSLSQTAATGASLAPEHAESSVGTSVDAGSQSSDHASEEPLSGLPGVSFTLNSSDNDLTREFYEPCLSWAKRYDRAVGYFSSGWLRENARGLSSFATRGGRVRWITSPIMDEGDLEAFQRGLETSCEGPLSEVLLRNMETLRGALEEQTLNALGWLVYDKILEFRFAVPTRDLEGGDFHDKFGVFSDDAGNRLSFNGSVNDSIKGTLNYESIKVFRSWAGLNDFVQDDENRFERLWNNGDRNVKVYSLPEAVKRKIFELRTLDRPYTTPTSGSGERMWRHQDEAVECFLNSGNGILEMATGTGKTRTALKIINRLLSMKSMDSVVVTAYGTDLLDQWYVQLTSIDGVRLYRHYGDYKQLSNFLLNPKGAILLVARSVPCLGDLVKFGGGFSKASLLVADEVHGMGSPELVGNLRGKLSPFKYRLGLSATPEREYDDDGNAFIQQEIGPVIFRFGLKDAIRRGIICGFDYFPMTYRLTPEDHQEIHRIIASYHAKKQRGELIDEQDLYRDLARVRKVSKAKLPLLEDFVKVHPEALDRAIIFVETQEYGKLVQERIIRINQAFHTYFGEDDRKNLVRFATGDINCLITCKRISEGIDVKTVKAVLLLSADRAKLQTIQRIGRSLRLDPTDPDKRAKVVDFICQPQEESREMIKDLSADRERMLWLEHLSTAAKEET